jgi:aminoglycoside/choline kinase family phosphotransferase
MQRLQLLENWLRTQLAQLPQLTQFSSQFPDQRFAISPASADASFRRYFRITIGDRSMIAMDAPPQQEDCGPFLHVGGLFAEAGTHVPVVLAQDLAQGFLLLSDLGSKTYLQALNEALNEDPDNAGNKANLLYHDAVAALLKIQLASEPGILPEYDEALLLKELNLFPDWYLGRHLQIVPNAQQKRELERIFRKIVDNNLAQPKVFVHRDYHSRNLMVTEPNPGILDFQDAVYGPITYDLVSLFKDAYIRWDEERILDWLIRYWEQARKLGLPVAHGFDDFYRDFEWMGVQRHIKVLGIFARLNYRDGKSSYLGYLPLVESYLRKACERYRELSPLLVLLDEWEANKPPETKVGYTF